MRAAILALFALPALACSVGEGEGWVKSDRLYVEDCWNGEYDMGPTFFAGNSSKGDKSLTIRVQKGDNIEEVSDGLVVLVNDLPNVRKRTGEELIVGMPPGVSPPGVPIVYEDDPPKVSLALYLHGSCHAQNGTLYSLDGSITFESLFSGDPYEDDTDELLTEARFDATFADPRNLVGADTPADFESHVTGYFRFFYQRGQPAQPFQ